MRKIVALFLALLMLVSLVSCATSEPATAENTEETIEKETKENSKDKETKEKEEEKKEVVYAKVTNPLTPERIAAIPIANASMSIDELRQICIDFLSLQVSFTWVPTESLTYRVDRHGVDVTIEEGKLYGGIPYVNTASGNIYRILRYYDTETGHLNISPLNVDKERFGTACSGSACWGWARVVNSSTLSWTGNMTPANGFIPVGPYETVDAAAKQFGGENGEPDCSDIAKKNGEQIMFQSYAQMKKADGLVNNGHVTMCSKDPVVVYNADGTINGEESYLHWCEQGLYTTSAHHDRVQDDGTVYKIQGNVDLKKTFASLYESGYLPFTFAEFLGTDPVDPSEVYFANSDDSVANTEGLTVTELSKLTLKANYSMSDVNTVIKDQDGKVVLDYSRPSTNHFVRSWKLSSAIPTSALQQYVAKGGHTIEISVQLSTGEKPVVYTAALVA